jgi:hypothetical protein
VAKVAATGAAAAVGAMVVGWAAAEKEEDKSYV